MKIKHLLEGAEPKMPGAPQGIQIMTPQQFVAKAGDMPSEEAEEELNEFAPGNSGGESGRWYTDDQMTDIVGDGWWNDLDVSGDISKQEMIQEAQAWLDDQGYNVQVLNCKLNDDDMEWYIEGSFINPNLAKKGVAEGLSKRDQQDVDAIRAAIARLEAQLNHPNADRDAIQQSIAHEKKRLALYGQGVAEGEEHLARIRKLSGLEEATKLPASSREFGGDEFQDYMKRIVGTPDIDKKTGQVKTDKKGN